MNSNIKTDNNLFLAEKYIEWVNSNIQPEKILILVQNPYKKFLFNEYIKDKIPSDITPQIYTFQGLIYNTIKNNQHFFDKSGKNPNLISLEISQFIFKECIKKVNFKDYNSKINLLHQLFKRYSLIVKNSLSEEDILNRSKILNESFTEDTQKAIEIFKKRTFELGAFDYLRQIPIFNYLYKNTTCLSEIKYLLAEDLDECTKSEFDFFEFILPQLQDYFITFDKNGGSRAGYLGAYLNPEKKIKSIFKKNLTVKEVKNKHAINLYNSIINNTKINEDFFENIRTSKRTEMLEACADKIKQLLKNGCKLSDITIISPANDTILRTSISEIFRKNNFKYQIISGNEKLSESPLIKAILNLIKLSENPEDIKVFELRNIIEIILKIPSKYCYTIIAKFKENTTLTQFDFKNEIKNKNYNNFLELLDTLKNNSTTISEKIINILNKFQHNFTSEEIEKISFLIKQTKDFETILGKNISDKELITQFENTIISENDANPEKIKKDSLTVITPQKCIDFSIKSKYQFWLDASDNTWEQPDTGTLYNAWVFHEEWNKNSFTYEDNLYFSKIKMAKILRKLTLLTSEKIFIAESEYNNFGIENEENTGIIKYFDFPQKTQPKTTSKFVPRDDQKPVLEYKKGSMAILAVPGAGKTTILLQLILKLINNGENPQNIFILTYMDSAAQNFKNKIKENIKDISQMPNVSTIHGLALKILKENCNYSKIGLEENFEIIDDDTRERIIRLLFSKLKIDETKFDTFEKGISTCKLTVNTNKKFISKEEKEFKNLADNYDIVLKKHNLIDYDDMLLLTYKLLTENKDIQEYYQNQTHFIIEDEAQDSSLIQQKIIEILTAKYKNLIRCGDINQSITTTFTNSDKKGFSNFAKQNTLVKMTSSQRCNEKIIETANNLIDFSKNKKEYKSAFFDIKMQKTQHNPISDNPQTIKLFDNYEQEKLFIKNKIREILNSEPQASIAILLRNNYQVEEYLKDLQAENFKTLTHLDILNKKISFNVILSIFKIINKPWDNTNLLDNYNNLVNLGIYKKSDEAEKYLKDNKSPFILNEDANYKDLTTLTFFWDIQYWLSNSHLEPSILACKIGDYYFNEPHNRANSQLVSLIISKLQNKNDLIKITQRLEIMAQKPIPKNFKFFKQNIQEEENIKSGKISVMTIHKSKGDEFDYIFIPEFTEDNFTLDIKKIKIQQGNVFAENIKSNTPRKTEDIKKDYIEETLRLIYVAITRAKKSLNITCAKKYKKFSRMKDTEPSLLFNDFFNLPQSSSAPQ